RRATQAGTKGPGGREGVAVAERAIRRFDREGIVLPRLPDAGRVPAGQPVRPHLHRGAAGDARLLLGGGVVAGGRGGGRRAGGGVRQCRGPLARAGGSGDAPLPRPPAGVTRRPPRTPGRIHSRVETLSPARFA